MFHAVLFDLDGTLVDSERESGLAMALALEEGLGVRVSQEELDFIVGRSWHEIDTRLRAAHGARLGWSLERLIDESTRARARVIAEQGMRILPGAVETVRRLGQGRVRALVTGSGRAAARQALDVLGLVDEFAVLFASEDYARGKPAPDGYLAAAAQLGVQPLDCLVVEDSRAGIAAGRDAGMTVVAVSIGNYLAQDQSAAHRIVPTLYDLTDELLAELAVERDARRAHA